MMAIASIVEKLHEMKLSTMSRKLEKQQSDTAISGLSFDERLCLHVDAEWISRRNNRQTRLVRKAGLSIPGACLEDIDYIPDRRLNKNLIAMLASCNYI
jgi:hypothetical protein